MWFHKHNYTSQVQKETSEVNEQLEIERGYQGVQLRHWNPFKNKFIIKWYAKFMRWDYQIESKKNNTRWLIKKCKDVLFFFNCTITRNQLQQMLDKLTKDEKIETHGE